MAIENGYCFCANEWFLDVRIKNELSLLLLLSSLSAKNGYSYADNEYLSNTLCTDNKTISRKLSKLQKLGFIKIIYEKRGCEVINREIRVTNLCTKDTKMSLDGCQKCHSTGDENVTDNNINIKNINYNNKKHDTTNVVSVKKDDENVCSKWNDIAQKWGLSQIRTLGSARRKNFKNLLAELNMETEEFFNRLEIQIGDSLYLRGKALNADNELIDRSWKCTFDFLIEPRTLGPRRGIPVIEGTYADADLVRIRKKREAMEQEVKAHQ